MPDVHESRCYLDSMVVRSPALSDVTITPIAQENFNGSWFAAKSVEPGATVLYFHGGGYSYYPRSYANFIALFTLAAKAKLFALDYRLSPEYPFPSQLEDALNAYRWLLNQGVASDKLVVAGDSAGGNLTLALLLRLRELRLPLPALAIALSPATDFAISRRRAVSIGSSLTCSAAGRIGSVIHRSDRTRLSLRFWLTFADCLRSTCRRGVAKFCSTAFTHSLNTRAARARTSRSMPGTT